MHDRFTLLAGGLGHLLGDLRDVAGGGVVNDGDLDAGVHDERLVRLRERGAGRLGDRFVCRSRAYRSNSARTPSSALTSSPIAAKNAAMPGRLAPLAREAAKSCAERHSTTSSHSPPGRATR